jgi:vacuolar-type H+-ATPase subunit E/Vma4
MALTDLVARLERDAAAEAEAIAARADAEIDQIRAAADRAAAGTVADELDRRRAVRTRARQQALALARRAARAAELEAQHAFIARVVARAHALAAEAAASPEYVRVLPSHVEEALSYVRGLRSHVRCQASARDVLAPIVGRTQGAEIVIDETVGPGVVVEAADGSVLVANTLEARLDRIAPALAVDLLKELDRAGA